MVKWVLGGIGILLCVAVGFVVYGFLAPLKVHFVTQLEAEPYPATPDEPTGPFVGLALSGGARAHSGLCGSWYASARGKGPA